MIVREDYYLGAPVTGRSADMLATFYGYGHGKQAVESLAADIQPESYVADFGAGLSSLGFAVCETRPDVRWTNIDVSYCLPEVTKQLPETYPDNLNYVTADVMDPSAIEMGYYDRVFSYFMFAHLALAGKPVARAALRNVISSANHKGILTLGPHRGFKAYSIEFDAPRSEAELSEQIDELVPLITLPRFVASRYKGGNHRAYNRRYSSSQSPQTSKLGSFESHQVGEA